MWSTCRRNRSLCQPERQGVRRPKKILVVREPFSDPPIATIKRIRKVDQKHFKGFALVSENPEYLPEMTDLDWPELVVGRAVWIWRSLEEA